MKVRDTVQPCCPPFPFVETGWLKGGPPYHRIMTMDDDPMDLANEVKLDETLFLICARCGKPAQPKETAALIVDPSGQIEALDDADATALAEQFEKALREGTGPFVFERPKKH